MDDVSDPFPTSCLSYHTYPSPNTSVSPFILYASRQPPPSSSFSLSGSDPPRPNSAAYRDKDELPRPAVHPSNRQSSWARKAESSRPLTAAPEGSRSRWPFIHVYVYVYALAMSAFMRLTRFYNSHFDRRPVPTLIVTNGILNSIADAIAQTSTIVLADGASPSNLAAKYDPVRTLRFCVFGMAMGPVIGRWMRFLEKAVPMKGVQGSAQYVQLGKRVFLDQAVMAPIGLTLFVSGMGFMEGRNVPGIQDKFKDMFFPALIANWKVWPAIQAINFKLMPLQYRVPFQSTMGIAWTLYLSLLNAGDDKKEAQKLGQ